MCSRTNNDGECCSQYEIRELWGTGQSYAFPTIVNGEVRRVHRLKLPGWQECLTVEQMSLARAYCNWLYAAADGFLRSQ